MKVEASELYNDLLPSCKEKYSKLNDCFNEDENFYELDFKTRLNLPDEFTEEGIVLPTARDMVDTFVDHIDIANARVFVNRKGTSDISAEEAEMMRKFYLGLIHRNNVEADISPWRIGAKHYALHGLAVYETLWDADQWSDKPDREIDESESDYALRIDEWRSQSHDSIPIVVHAVNPGCVLPDPSYGGREFVFKVLDKVCLDMQRRYPKWSNPKGKKISGEVEKVEYWDNKERCIWVDGEPVLQVKGGMVKHKYGFIPYVFIDSGLGNISKDYKPEKRYVGVLRHIVDLLVSESRSYSISEVVLKKAAWPYLTISGKNAALVAEISQKYGKLNVLPEGVELKEIVSQTPPDALNSHLYRTSDYIAAHAAPRSLRGLGEQGVRSGADRRLVIGEAASKYRYSEDAFRNGAAKILSNCARLMKNVVPGDVRLWARTPTDEFDVEIKKDKMKEPFTCYVEFAPVSEEDEYRRHDDLERLVAAGIVTRPWSRTQMSNVDPKAMEIDEERERLKNDPNIQMVISQYAAGKLMAEISKRSVAEGLTEGLPPPPPVQQGPLQQGPLQPEAGRRIVPPIPNVAPLGSAEAIQNQLKGMRSQSSIFPMQGVGGGGNRP